MAKRNPKASIDKQKQRYDKEAMAYLHHHGDEYSQKYRTWAIRGRLFNFDLNGLKVLDAMGGPGVETGYLISRGGTFWG